MKNKGEQSDCFLPWDLVIWSKEKSNSGGREAAAEVKEAAIVTAVETPAVIVVGGAVELDEDIIMNTAFDNEREATAGVADAQDVETSAPEDIVILRKDPVLSVRDNSLSGEEEICDSVELDILDQLDIDEEETDDRIEQLLEARRAVDDPADSNEEYHKYGIP